MYETEAKAEVDASWGGLYFFSQYLTIIIVLKQFKSSIT